MSSQLFDAKAVRALADILVATDLTEIEVEHKDGRIRVVRTPAVQHVVQPIAHPAAAPVAAPAPGQAITAAPAEEATHPGIVPSPMVGVAYLAPEPGAAPYVTLGQTVSAGQTLLLIEAMKTYNQIKAPKSGTVIRILVTPGQPVEFGQPLMILE